MLLLIFVKSNLTLYDLSAPRSLLVLRSFMNLRYRQAADRGWPPAHAALERLQDRQKNGPSDQGKAGEEGAVLLSNAFITSSVLPTSAALAKARSVEVTADNPLEDLDEPRRDAPLEEALAWYRTAAELGDVHAQAQLGACLRHRHRIFSPTDRSSDNSSSSWNWSSSGGGLTSTRGNGVVLVEALRDVAGAMEAAHWLEAASASGHAGAAATLAVLYLEGRLPKVKFADARRRILYLLHVIIVLFI